MSLTALYTLFKRSSWTQSVNLHYILFKRSCWTQKMSICIILYSNDLACCAQNVKLHYALFKRSSCTQSVKLHYILFSVFFAAVVDKMPSFHQLPSAGFDVRSRRGLRKTTIYYTVLSFTQFKKPVRFVSVSSCDPVWWAGR